MKLKEIDERDAKDYFIVILFCILILIMLPFGLLTYLIDRDKKGNKYEKN